MKKILLVILFVLCGCGVYAGLDGVHYLPEGLPKEAESIEIIPETVTRAGLAGLMGPFAPYATVIMGGLGLIASFFSTKKIRKKKGY